jgi:hypothetical protein
MDGLSEAVNSNEFVERVDIVGELELEGESVVNDKEVTRLRSKIYTNHQPLTRGPVDR